MEKTKVTASLLPKFTISLSQIFKNVNIQDKRFLKYVPDAFLNDIQIDAKKRLWKIKARNTLNIILISKKRAEYKTLPTLQKTSELASQVVPPYVDSLHEKILNVNIQDKRFLKYVPDEFLDSSQIEAKRKALENQSEEYNQYKVDSENKENVSKAKQKTNENINLSSTDAASKNALIYDGELGKLINELEEKLSESERLCKELEDYSKTPISEIQSHKGYRSRIDKLNKSLNHLKSFDSYDSVPAEHLKAISGVISAIDLEIEVLKKDIEFYTSINADSMLLNVGDFMKDPELKKALAKEIKATLGYEKQSNDRDRNEVQNKKGAPEAAGGVNENSGLSPTDIIFDNSILQNEQRNQAKSVKKEDVGVINTPQDYTASGGSQTSSTIRISALLEFVNDFV